MSEPDYAQLNKIRGLQVNQIYMLTKQKQISQ